MNKTFCGCKRCKAARRKGLVLGARWERSWKYGMAKVSAYVPYHRWAKGRRPITTRQEELKPC